MNERLQALEARVRELVAHRRRDDPHPDDPFRGLYLPDEEIDRLLASAVPPPEPAPDVVADTLPGGRLGALAAGCGLLPVDVAILVAALAPDVDARFERLYGYLNDDVTRRRATTGLVLDLVGVPARVAAARARLAPGAPLLEHRLVLVEDEDRPFLSRALRVPDRVVAHLLGDDTPDATLLDVLGEAAPLPGPAADALGRVLAGGAPLGYVRDPGRRTGPGTAVAALAAAGRGAVLLDLTRAAGRPAPEELVRVAGREAQLRGAGVVAGPVEALTELTAADREGRPGTVTGTDALRRLAGLPVPVLLVGDVTWDPSWSERVPALAEAPALLPEERDRAWRARLADAAEAAGGGPAATPPLHLRLGPEQIARAVTSARLSAELDGVPLDGAALQAGARAQNAAGLERLSRRVEPAVGWDDLVLTPAVTVALHDLTARARHRDRVLGEWRMRPGGGRGHGVTALFAGDSGTGKTMSAEVIAGDLGLDLYKVDLATVVDKYVGETEKNLERIFAEAAGVNAVLLFDEADAVFGKRSEVRDAHDRYANIESAYLLQRMETFEGLAILATNLRANIDDAFTRRLDCIVDFPDPGEDLRLRLWRQCLAPPLPLGDDLDLEFCAAAFDFTGGNIRSAAVTAAYLAAQSDRPVGMAELVAAVGQEYRKLGRLVLEREFGSYLALLRRDPRAS